MRCRPGAALWDGHGTAVLRTVARDGEPGAYFTAAGATIQARGYVAPEGVNDVTVSYGWELRCYDAGSHPGTVLPSRTAVNPGYGAWSRRGRRRRTLVLDD